MLKTGLGAALGVHESRFSENSRLPTPPSMNFLEARLPDRLLPSLHYSKKVKINPRSTQVNKLSFAIYILYRCRYGCSLDILFASLA